jgi:hypothetical protein
MNYNMMGCIAKVNSMARSYSHFKIFNLGQMKNSNVVQLEHDFWYQMMWRMEELGTILEFQGLHDGALNHPN